MVHFCSFKFYLIFLVNCFLHLFLVMDIFVCVISWCVCHSTYFPLIEGIMEATMVINSGPIEACRACLASRCLPIVITAVTNTFKSSCTRNGNSLGGNKQSKLEEGGGYFTCSWGERMCRRRVGYCARSIQVWAKSRCGRGLHQPLLKWCS